ncbi:MAG: hypothetical protein KC431_12100, partial [Myxococcales bacterium]|nr:hypothetical protein [Myxococcales bacterium]
MLRLRSSLAPICLAALGLACKPPAITDGDEGTDDVDTSSTGTEDTTSTIDTDTVGTETNGTTTSGTTGGPTCATALDILVVLDNSGSMGEAQR